MRWFFFSLSAATKTFQSTQVAHDPEVLVYSRTPKNAPTELRKGKGNARQHKASDGAVHCTLQERIAVQ